MINGFIFAGFLLYEPSILGEKYQNRTIIALTSLAVGTKKGQVPFSQFS